MGATLGAAAASTLAACGGNNESSDDSLTVLMEDISYTDNIKNLLPDFTEQTGITVNIETVPYSDMSSKILQEFSQQSDYFDAVFIDNVYGSGYFESQYVEDLTGYAEKDSTFGTLDSYYEPYLKPMTTPDGAVFGLPIYGESTFLMYRTDLFSEHGLEVPSTMEELRAAAEAIQKDTNSETSGITLRGAPGIQSVYPWAGFLRSFGGNFFDQSGQLALASDQAIEAAEFWAKLLQDCGPAGAANFGWEQNRINFTQGLSAMTIDATANGPFNEDPESSSVAGKVGYAAIPYADGVDPGENTNNSLTVHALYMNAFGSNKDNTWKFMSWATGKNVQTEAVKTTEAVGVTHAEVLDGEAYAEKYGAFQEAVKKQLATGNVNYLPSGKNANTIITETGQALSTALSGQEEASTALGGAHQNIVDQGAGTA